VALVNGGYPQQQITVLHWRRDAAWLRLDAADRRAKHSALVAQMLAGGPWVSVPTAEPF